ncbi:MAG: MCE family protein [Actinomycetota bacterium]|nr:MCE family protein [Actinomycetota bacterium]
MAPPLKHGRALGRQRAIGLVFLGLVCLMVRFTIALYQHSFTRVAIVDLLTDHTGNQLSRGADVRLRGVQVGTVRSVSSLGRGADVRLALDPAKLDRLPADLHAQLLPKTLFGEAFVALVPSPGSSARPLRDGDVVAQDRTQAAFATSQALDDLLPLLKALNPEAVSRTLNALSSSLRGRGDALGQNLVRTGAYLKAFNPSLGRLQADQQGLADLSNSYAVAAPDLLRTLDNLSFSSRSLVDQQAALTAFLHSTTDFAASARDVVATNADRLVRLARVSVGVAGVFARYAPEYACVLKGIVDITPEGERVFGGAQPGLHIRLLITRDQGPYAPGDEPVFGDDHGPTCYGLDKHVVPFPFYRTPKDGYRYPSPSPTPFAGADPANDPARYVAGGALGDRARFEAALAAPVLGLPANQVPDLVSLLFGPLARGGSVGYEVG